MKRKKPKFSLTKGQKKIFAYFEEIMKTDYFVKTISELRKKYRIPPKNGFGLHKEDGSRLIMIPRDWIQKTTDLGQGRVDAVYKDIENICKKFHLSPYTRWRSMILSALFYKEPVFSLSFDLCDIWDLAWEEEIIKKFPPAKEWLKEHEYDPKIYPIAIMIGPYASQRDILDYIKKNYKTRIFPSQEKKKNPDVGIGKFKLKNQLIRLRNEFIYQHRHLPRKEIANLVRGKLKEVIDYALIGKIISLERKKRKEV